MAFPGRVEYETLIYNIGRDFPQIQKSTLHLYSTSALTAIVEGDLWMENGLRLRVMEVIDFKAGQIRKYSYEVYRGGEKIRWYDTQPHPNDAALEPTFPHHYHEEPDIKHHRLPALGISFFEVNLPSLIRDCTSLT